jgi:hypothetical protein
MTAPLPSDRTAALNAVEQTWAADDTALSASESQIATLTAEVATLTAELAAASPYPPTGAYLPTPAAASAFVASGPVAVNRVYNAPGHIPDASQPLGTTGQVTTVAAGLTVLVVSIKPDHPTYDQDAAVAGYASRYAMACKAMGVRPILIIEHEPENKDKQPADSPAAYAADWMHYRQVVKLAAPDVEVWACFMTYTLNARPPDNLGHTTAGQNEWVQALHAACILAGVAPDGIAFDGYPDAAKGETAASNFTPSFVYVHGMAGWSRMPVAAAEWGLAHPSGDAALAAHISAGVDFFRAVGAVFVAWFDSGAFAIETFPVIGPLLAHNPPGPSAP